MTGWRCATLVGNADAEALHLSSTVVLIGSAVTAVCFFVPLILGADDRFDPVVGVFGMLNVVRGARLSGEPENPAIRRIEGWILGQVAVPEARDSGAHGRA